jgi:GNAT superfamily N-acetyltransferase
VPADVAPPAGVTLRPATVADAAACARVLRGSRAAAMPWLPVLHSPEEDLAYLTGVLGRMRAWVAGTDDGVVGFAVVDTDAGVLDHLYLDPGVQRRGIGSALLAAARASYDGPLELWVFADNAAARAFYAAHGGVELYATDGSGNEERTPDVRMRLPAPDADAGQ